MLCFNQDQADVAMTTRIYQCSGSKDDRTKTNVFLVLSSQYRKTNGKRVLDTKPALQFCQ